MLLLLQRLKSPEFQAAAPPERLYKFAVRFLSVLSLIPEKVHKIEL